MEGLVALVTEDKLLIITLNRSILTVKLRKKLFFFLVGVHPSSLGSLVPYHYRFTCWLAVLLALYADLPDKTSLSCSVLAAALSGPRLHQLQYRWVLSESWTGSTNLFWLHGFIQTGLTWHD